MHSVAALVVDRLLERVPFLLPAYTVRQGIHGVDDEDSVEAISTSEYPVILGKFVFTGKVKFVAT